MDLFQPIISGSLTVSGSVIISGSLSSTQGFTGSFSGIATSASYALSSSLAQTASFVNTAQTASYFITSSVTNATSASLAQTASFVVTAQTASSIANLNQNVQITGSLTTSGTLTAQTLVVQTVTSSIIYSSGSNIFGNQLTDVQQMTGSLRVTGSGNHYILGGNVGIQTSSPVSTNLTGSLTIVKSYNGDTPASTTAQNYYDNQSNLFLFGRNAGLTMVSNLNEECVIAFASPSSSYMGGIRYNTESTPTGGAMRFQTSGSTERMRITASGSVVIGSTTANSRLDVASIYASDTTTQVMFRDDTGGGLLFGGTSGAAKWIQAQDYSGAATYYNLLLNPRGGSIGIGSTTVYNGGGFEKVISFYSPSSLALTYVTNTQQYQVGIASTDYRVYDFTGSTYRFVIKGSTGNVVIGDTADNGEKLQVNGGTTTSYIRSTKGTTNVGYPGNTTLFTLPGSTFAFFQVYAYLASQGTGYSAFATLVQNNTGLAIANSFSGGLVTLSVSGLNVQASQGSGNAQDINWVYLKIQ
jgi:hypothetical protein